MKRFFQSRLILTLAAFTIVAAAIVIPLSNSTVHTHAQSQLLPYPTAVLADSPVLYYRLGEPSGSVAVDSSGNGHNGVYAGGVTLGQPGAIASDKDTSASFDGSTGIVDSGTNVISTSSTIEAWIQPTDETCFDPSCSDGQSAIAGTGGSFQLTYGRIPGEVLVWLWPQDNSGWIVLAAPTPIPLGKWTYVVTTWDGTTLSIYINGTRIASRLLPGVISSYQSFNSYLPFTFNLAGFEPAPQQQYHGGLDEVAYYNHALSADRILAHYTAAVDVSGFDISGFGGRPSSSFWDQVRSDGMSFVIVDTYRGISSNGDAANEVSDARSHGLKTAAYFQLNFKSKDSGSQQVEKALALLLGNPIAFMAIGVEPVPTNYTFCQDLSNPKCFDARNQRILEAVQDLLQHKPTPTAPYGPIQPVIYTRNDANAPYWSEITGDSKLFSQMGVPLWDTQNDGDPELENCLAGGWITLGLSNCSGYGGWTQRMGKQYDLGLGNGVLLHGVLVDLDIFDPSLFP